MEAFKEIEEEEKHKFSTERVESIKFIRSVSTATTIASDGRNNSNLEDDSIEKWKKIKRVGVWTAYAFFRYLTGDFSNYSNADELEAHSRASFITWKEMSDEEKKPFHDLMLKDKERWKYTMKNYYMYYPFFLGVNKNDREEKINVKNIIQKMYPKSSVGAFFWFYYDELEKMKNENHECSIVDIVKKLAKKWSNIDAETKAKYEDMATKDLTRFKEEYDAYTKAMSEVENLENTNIIYEDQKDNIQLDNDWVERWKCKKRVGTWNAYAYFCSLSGDFRNISTKNELDAHFNESSTIWQQISDEEKKPFEEMATSDKERWKHTIGFYMLHPFYHQTNDNNIEKNKKLQNIIETMYPEVSVGAFFWFAYDQREKVKMEHPESSAFDIVKELAKKWLSVDVETHSKYQDMAEKDLNRFKREYNAYAKEMKETEALENDKLHEQAATIQKPLGRKTAYAFFCDYMDLERIENPPNDDHHHIFSATAMKWKTLPVDERKLFQQMAIDDKLRWEYQMKIYKSSLNVSEKNDNQGENIREEKYPEEPRSAYEWFYIEALRIIKMEHPKISDSDIVNLVKKKWRNADEITRDQYMERAVKDLQMYAMNLEVYLRKAEGDDIFESNYDSEEDSRG